MSFLRKLTGRIFGRKEADQLPVSTGGTPVEKTEGGRMWARFVNERVCPKCNTPVTHVGEGPQGGVSTNIELKPCGHWFNATPLIGSMEYLR